MKKCPFCAEEIQDEAIKCRHCGSMLKEAKPTSGFDEVSRPSFPFTPIPGATPTSGVLYFALAFLLLIVSFVLAPFGPIILVLGTSIWAGFDAATHKLAQYQNGIGGPAGACVGSLLLWIFVFPWYLAIRSRIRAGVQPVKF